MSNQRRSGQSLITRGIRAVSSLVGVAFIVLAAVLVFNPEAVESALPVTTIIQTPLVSNDALRAGAFLAFGTICALWIIWTTPSWLTTQVNADATSTDVDFDALRADPPEQAGETDGVGELFDQKLESAKKAAISDRTDVARDHLRSLVSDGLVISQDYSAEEAQVAIEDGTWTDDAVAAAYIANRESSLPFRKRVINWLRPAKTREKRITRSINAIITAFDSVDSVDRNEEKNQ